MISVPRDLPGHRPPTPVRPAFVPRPSTYDPIPDGRMIYLVPSEVRPSIRYRVDLLENGGGGRCQCTDHNTRRQPFLDKGGDPFDAQGACKHVRKAREFFLRGLLSELARQEQQK
jgi:hypothetical protein